MNNKYTQLVLYAVHFTYGLHNIMTKKGLCFFLSLDLLI